MLNLILDSTQTNRCTQNLILDSTQTNRCTQISEDLNCQLYDELKDDVNNATSSCKRI